MKLHQAIVILPNPIRWKNFFIAVFHYGGVQKKVLQEIIVYE
jgi:hypothetical protein